MSAPRRNFIRVIDPGLPLEEKLTRKGYTVIDSQWITPGY
jgi:hypothetical protein